jgi:2-methylcitrate dehydratase PrpD
MTNRPHPALEVEQKVKASEPLTSALGRFVSQLQIGSLAARDVATLKLAVMDCLAAAIAGAHEQVTDVSLRMLGTYGGKDARATILGHSMRAPVLDAAFVNGAMAHACDFDDVSEPMCGHPTAPSLPAILAAAELRSSAGHEVLVALAAAIEVMTKLGRAAGHELYRSGWHATATLGVFGAAAGAARILGLDAERTATAIAIAASRAAGIRANIGTTVKPLHCGFAARDGLEAALLASAGATASPRALDGPTGFLNTFAPRYDRLVDVAGMLGRPFDTQEPGIVFKKYPSCWDTHSGIEAILSLRQAHDLKPEQVRSIRCFVAPGMGADLVYSEPKTPIQGKFSMQFCAAVALARGRVSLDEFTQNTLDDPAIRHLILNSTLEFDQELASADSKSFCAAARVEIELHDGRVVSETVKYMRGHPRNPMSVPEFEEKMFDSAESVLSPAQIRRLSKMLSQFDQLADVRELMSALVPE